MALKKTLQVLQVEEKTAKSGYKYRVAQCVLKDTEGKIKVGELMLFNPDLPVAAGEYDAEFEMVVDREGKVSAQVVALVPLAMSRSNPLSTAKAA